jgi:hypothetical protein
VDDRRLDYYAVGVLLPSLPKAIGSFHRTHNPTADLIGPHLTLVYPVPASTGRDAFLGHVRGVVSGTPPFDIRLRGLEKSWDHFLFLLVTEGREEVVALHDALYTEILRPHLWTDRPYVPHVTLGLFAKERDAHDLLELRRGRSIGPGSGRPCARPRRWTSTTDVAWKRCTSSGSTRSSPTSPRWRNCRSARTDDERSAPPAGLVLSHR